MTGPLEHHDPFADLPTSDDVRGLTRELARQDRRGKWNRRLIYALAFGFACLLVLGLLAWRSVAYSNCATDRSRALTGPGNERINLFFQAYTEAAGQTGKPLTEAQTSAVIAELDRARGRYKVLPAHAALVKAPPSQLLAFRDLIRSLHANDVYNVASKHHPVCSLWSM